MVQSDLVTYRGVTLLILFLKATITTSSASLALLTLLTFYITGSPLDFLRRLQTRTKAPVREYK